LLLHRTVLFLALYSLTSSVLAETLPDPAYCPQDTAIIAGDAVPVINITNNQTVISADDSSVHGNIFRLDGHVLITDRDKQIRADHISYDNDTGQTSLSGNISLSNEGFQVKATEGQANTRNNTAQFNNLEYQLRQFPGRGKASTVNILGKQQATLKKVTYSTCPRNRQDWVLKADNVKIDQSIETARAKNVSIWFKGIPLMYLPQFSFPTGNMRKSGFLNPSIAQSTKTGTELRIPWYWNIAPDRDATFSLQYMSDRGTKLNSEFRQLHRQGSSTFEFDTLDDSVRNDNRIRASILHSSRLTQDWKLRTDLNYVSDQQYFDDLGEGLENSNITYLARDIELQRDLSLGYGSIRLHEFQSLNVANTYQRLPQIRLDLESASHKAATRYNLEAELTRFDHRDDVTKGTRLDLSPGISYEWADTAYYIRPGFKLRHTHYQLHNTPAGQQKQLTRSTPIFSLDSGIFLERPVQLWGRSQTLTLEPRLFYLYAAYENQDSFPVFDTTAPDFRFAELFRTNRFTGPDRQADANQLTLALSSRLIDDSRNRERLRLNIGQTLYFNDRRVGLPGSITDAGNYSDFTGEVEGQFTDSSQFRISGIWDPDSSEVNKAVLAYGYRKDKRHTANLSYRYQRGLFEQTTLSSRWQIGRHWNGLVGWTYSLRDRQTNESLLGLEYDTCCWSIQIGARQYLNSSGTEKDNSVYIQLNLKGMSSLGSGIGELSENELNYRTLGTVQ
jgi:LPS-assembly protein